MGSVHRLPIRVYYEDTDFSGVVYHASYLRFFERGRTEHFRALGMSHAALFSADPPIAFVVRRMTIDFLRPARMDDLLSVETRCAAVRGASLDISQKIYRETELLVAAGVKIACIAGMRATRIPDALRSVMAPDGEPGES
jgi:acyl-CoA thioester hydrolase